MADIPIIREIDELLILMRESLATPSDYDTLDGRPTLC
jgi:hypothetical protein